MGALDDFEAKLGGLDAYEQQIAKPKSELAAQYGDRIRKARNGPVGIKEPEKRDKAESFFRAAAQTGTLGFSDELTGGIRAAAGAIADLHEGRDPSARGEFADVYRAERDAANAEDEKAELANPMTSFAGNLAGALPTAPLAAGKGILGAFFGGAKVGTAAGLGTSKADLTQGDVVDAADDAATGGLLGGTFGAGLTATGMGLSRLFQPSLVRAAERLGGKAGGLGNPVAEDIAVASRATGQEPSIAALGNASPKAADSLRRLFTKDADAAIIAANAERNATTAGMDLRAAEMNPRTEAELLNGVAASRDAAQRQVAGARQGVIDATEEALNRKAKSSLNSQRLAAGRESDRIRESLLTGREIPRSRGNNPRIIEDGAAQSMAGTPKSKLITEAKEVLAKSKDNAKSVSNRSKDLKELIKPDSVARERAKMAGNRSALDASRSRLMEKEIPGKFSQQAIDQLKRDGDQAAQELIQFDKLLRLNSQGREAISRSRPGILEQLGVKSVPGRIAASVGSGGLAAPYEFQQFLNDRALAKVAKDPALVREVIEMLAKGFDRRKLSPALQAILTAEGANLAPDQD